MLIAKGQGGQERSLGTMTTLGNNGHGNGDDDDDRGDNDDDEDDNDR